MVIFLHDYQSWSVQDVPGWMQAEGSLGSSSGTSMNSMSLSLTSMSSSLPSPSVQDPLDLDTTCSEALEENWVSILGSTAYNLSVH